MWKLHFLTNFETVQHLSGHHVQSLISIFVRVIAVTPLKPPDDAPPPASLYDLYHSGGTGQDEREEMVAPGQPQDPSEDMPPLDQGAVEGEGVEGERVDPPGEKMDPQDAVEEPAVVEEGLKGDMEGLQRMEDEEGEGQELQGMVEREREELREMEGEGQEAESMAVQMEAEEKDTASSSLFPEEEARKVTQCLQSLRELLERAKHCTVSTLRTKYGTQDLQCGRLVVDILS